MVHSDSRPPPPLRRHHRRWPRHHGSRQPRRPRSRRQDHRPQHQSALRTESQFLHHPRAQLRVPLFLHAQVLVRLPRQSPGHFPRRLRHHRRTFRNPHSRPNRQTRQENSRRHLRQRILAPHHELPGLRRRRHHCPRRPRPVQIRRHAPGRLHLPPRRPHRI